jgi:hypothetical protein
MIGLIQRRGAAFILFSGWLLVLAVTDVEILVAI